MTIAGQKPADVRLPETAGHGRVDIVLGVCVQVVGAMMRRPPERPLLVRGRAGKRERELEDAVGLVCAMREEAMKARGDGEHAHDVQG